MNESQTRERKLVKDFPEAHEKLLKNYLFIYFWLCWVFVSVRGLSLVAASGGHSSSRCAGLSLLRPLFLRSTGSRRAGSVVVAHGPRCSAACGIFPDQGSNPCPLHWQANSQPLHHQGSPWKASDGIPAALLQQMFFKEAKLIFFIICTFQSRHFKYETSPFSIRLV